MSLARFTSIAVCSAAFALLAPVVSAADESYAEGTVWEFSYIQTEPGQFENYLDWLDGPFKKQNDFLKKEGSVVSYHVLQVNSPRGGEPDLLLAIEYKDYLTTAQRHDLQKRVEDMMAMDAHKMDAASGDRKAMRKLMGGMELQELKLK